MRRLVAALCVLAAIAGPGLSRADHCASAIVVFSRTAAQRDAGVAAVNPNVVFCASGAEVPLDTRLLVPFAAEISIRYTVDLGPSVPALTAVVNGLGFAGTTVSLPRFADPTTGLLSYASPFVAIPAGATAEGSIRVRIDHAKIAGGFDAVCFHTVAGSC